MRHVEHRPHPLPITHHTVNTVEPWEVDMPLPWQQDMTGLHPPDIREIFRKQKDKKIQISSTFSFIPIRLPLTGERSPSGVGIPMPLAHHTAGTLSGIHSSHLGNMSSVRCLQSLQRRGWAFNSLALKRLYKKRNALILHNISGNNKHWQLGFSTK